jgi:hypothetical protein
VVMALLAKFCIPIGWNITESSAYRKKTVFITIRLN